MLEHYPTRIECDCCDTVLSKIDKNEGFGDFTRRAEALGWRDKMDALRWLWKCPACVAAGLVVGRVRA